MSHNGGTPDEYTRTYIHTLSHTLTARTHLSGIAVHKRSDEADNQLTDLTVVSLRGLHMIATTQTHMYARVVLYVSNTMLHMTTCTGLLETTHLLKYFSGMEHDLLMTYLWGVNSDKSHSGVTEMEKLTNLPRVLRGGGGGGKYARGTRSRPHTSARVCILHRQPLCISPCSQGLNSPVLI